MMTKHKLNSLILGLMLAGIQLAAETQPNILLILADDLGYSDLSIQGCTDFETPNIDSIAKGGVRFNQGYVSNSVCAPSRAGLLSGRIGIGFESNIPENKPYGLDPSVTTMADVLKGAGYKTCCIGKWHLGYLPEYHPNRRGFDEFYGLLGGSRSYFADDLQDLIRHGKALEHNGVFEEEPEGSYVTDRLTAGAVSYINAHAKAAPDQPFFMYLSYTAPHGPWHAKPGYAERFPHIQSERRRIYAGMMASLDEGVGEVLDCLKENNLYEDTLIVFLSDNGGPLGPKAASNGPLKEGKGTLWEGGVRVPFFLQWPARVPAGQVLDYPVISLDLLPTFAKIAGAEPVESSGIDIMPGLLEAERAVAERDFFWRRGGMQQCALRIGKYKWILNRNKGESGLYDIDADMGEKRNLLSQLPEVAEAMEEKYKAWEASVPPPAFESGWKPKKK